jgi:hypothetical protein
MHGEARRFVSNLSGIACTSRGSQNQSFLPGKASRQALNILHIRRRAAFSLPIVSNTLPGDLFRAALLAAEKAAL